LLAKTTTVVIERIRPILRVGIKPDCKTLVACEDGVAMHMRLYGLIS